MLIYIPENPDDSQSHQGRVLDVSAHGMQVQIDGMDEASYAELSREVRRVRLSLKNTITGQQIQLPGSIAWHTYHEAEGPADSPHCKMGITIDTQDSAENTLYADFVKSLSRS